ncbi:hypothetical protein [Ewingella allii]|uniref:hypothetical protein n=1 Tax=Ewingella allii TaxID=3092550 RepID=UPI0037A038CA
MDKNDILEELKRIEISLGVELPYAYKKFLSEEVQDKEIYEIDNSRGALFIYLII